MGNPQLISPDPFPKGFERTVQSFDDNLDAHELTLADSLTMYIANAASDVPAWGYAPRLRDFKLRQFWPTETYLAGAMATIAIRNAAFEWEVQAKSDKLAEAVTDMLNRAIVLNEFGWEKYVMADSLDKQSQDNGCFTEIIRDPTISAGSRFKGPNAPVIGIGHLDAYYCQRTGNPEYPVIYSDINGKRHKMPYYNIITDSNMPSPLQTMYGIGYSCVTLTLRAAEILRDIMVYKSEKVSGRFFKAIHFVSGVSQAKIDAISTNQQEKADNQGLFRYIQPMILASLDPEKPVSTDTIELASMPDDYDEDTWMRWYITALANGFATDYQEFAPLATSNIGTGGGDILNKKSRGKSPALWMRNKVKQLKYHGVLPKNVDIKFKEIDIEEELQIADKNTKVAEELAIEVRAGILTTDAARAILKARGIYDEDILNMIPEGYGEELLIPSKQNVGKVSQDTMAEDVRRTKGKELAGDFLEIAKAKQDASTD